MNNARNKTSQKDDDNFFSLFSSENSFLFSKLKLKLRNQKSDFNCNFSSFYVRFCALNCREELLVL